MSAIMWVSAGVALWSSAAVLVSIVVGRVVRVRDSQVPVAHPQDGPVDREPVTAGGRADGKP
jgi:hypothetical protein